MVLFNTNSGYFLGIHVKSISAHIQKTNKQTKPNKTLVKQPEEKDFAELR